MQDLLLDLSQLICFLRSNNGSFRTQIYNHVWNSKLEPKGCDIKLGDLDFEPPREGPTLWEIGIPDRSEAEFYIPDTGQTYRNQFFDNNLNRFRQYRLWEIYPRLYPNADLVYTVGQSDYTKDWFSAQVNSND